MTADDGVLLRGAWRAGSNADGRSVLLLHGFGEDRSQLIDRASWLASQGFGVALLDSRGRGESEGPFTTFGGRESADLALWVAYVRTIVCEHAPIFAWGRSMGSAIALRAAAEGVEFAGLILEAPYADLVESVGSWLTLAGVPRFFAGPILWRAATLCGVALRSPRPIDLAAVVNSPVLILHGEADPIIPPPEAARLADSFASPPRVLAIPGARHNDVFPLAGTETREAIAAFLNAGCDQVFSKLDRPGDGA
jgi:alpha-beta hydrolase superfamily lysophospholipase